MTDRLKKERDRLRMKRLDVVYLARERLANKERMRRRRGNRKTAYVALERKNGWWQA